MELSNFKLRYFVATVALILCALLGLTSCPYPHCCPHITVNPKELAFTANESGSKTVNISTNASPWVAIPAESWIHASQGGATTILSVSVDPNPNTEYSREGQIVVTAGEAPAVMIKITQAPMDKIELNPTSLSFEPNDKVEKRVLIMTNASEWSFTPASNASWLECSKNDNELIVKPKENNNISSARSAMISITAGSAETQILMVTQK